MKVSSKKLKLICLLSLSLTGTGRLMSQAALDPGQLRQDFVLFRTALQEAHPGLYRYNAVAHMDSLFDGTEAALNKDMTQQEFYKILLPIVSQIKCGHTKLHPDNNWTDNYFFEKEKLFPLRLTFIDDKAYALYSYSEEKIPAGAEIIRINDVPVAEIIETLLPGFFSDGNNTTFKYIELGKYFSAAYANVIGTPDKFGISYITGGVEKTMKMAPVNYKTIASHQDKQKEHREPYSVQFPDSTTALMTILSFAEEGNEKYKKFLRRTFNELSDRPIKNLIIDVRDNEGGEDKRGSLLLSYLVDKNFRYYDRLEATTDKKFSFAENAYLPEFYGILRTLLTRTDSGTVLWKHSHNLKIQKPQKNHFNGRVYVLINGASFSVTAEFAAVAHYLKRAVFIGEETGGGYFGNNSGTFVIAKLPNSGLNVGIPMLAYYTAVKGYPYPDHGVHPDYEVRPSVDDLLKGKDTVLGYTLELIRNQNILP